MSVGIHVRIKHKVDKKATPEELKDNPEVISDGVDLQSSIHQYIKDFPKSKCIQIFTHGPSSKRMCRINIPKLHSLTKTHNIYVHSTYMTAWGNTEKRFAHICEQLITSEAINACGLVIHLPKNNPKFVVENIKKWVGCLLPDSKTKILLEVRSIRPDGDNTYETPEKLITLIEAIKGSGLTSDKFGIILDTAHIYVGYAPIIEGKEAEEYLSSLDDYKEWFPMLHLNGNSYDAQVRAGDKHTTPLSQNDKIWGGMEYENSGCKVFVDKYLSWGSDIILEIDHHKKNPRKFLYNI